MANFRDFSDWSFHVVTLGPDGHKVDEYLCLTNNIRAANAAFYALVPERPGRVVLLMNRQRIVRDSREPEDMKGS